MFTRNKFLIVSLLLVSVLSLFSTQSLAQEEVELTFWHHEAPSHRVKAIEDIINKFEAEYPNIEINQEVVSWGDAWSKTLSATKAGTTPDFQLDIPDFNVFASNIDSIISVDDIVQNLDEEYTYFDNVLKMYRHGGHYWGVPINTMIFNWIYRPSYLREYVGTDAPPKTWEEVLEYAEKLTVDEDGDGETDIYGIGLVASKSLATQEFFWSILTTYGGHVYDEDGNVDFNTPETVEALKTYKKLWEYTPPEATGWIWGEAEMNFSAGKIAMMPYFPSVQKRLYDADDLDLGSAPMPTPETGGQQATLIYPNGIMVHKSAEERGVLDEVKKFIQFVMEPENNALLTAGMEPGGFYPCTEAARESGAFWENDYVKAFPRVNDVALQEVQNGTLYGFTHDEVVNKGIGDVVGANVLAEVVQRVIVEDQEVESAVEWAHEEIEELS